MPNTSNNKKAIADFSHLFGQKLLDTANYYFEKRSDTALICYGIIMKSYTEEDDEEQVKRIVEAYNKAAGIHYYMSDYRTAYEFFIEALFLSEKHNFTDDQSKIYANIGNIYASFKDYDIAKLYYNKALNLCQDSAVMIILLNNLGDAELKSEKMDSAFYYLNQSLKICKRHNNIHSHLVLNTLASYYQKSKCYDSAYYYYQLSLDEIRPLNRAGKEAEYLSTLSKMFFETKKIDSALHYIRLSNAIAKEGNFLEVMSDNFRTLSKIEELKGDTKSAFEFFKKHAILKDSIFNIEIFGDISQLQRLYEVSKSNQQIEQLIIEKQIKKRTIYLQKIIWLITFTVLILVLNVLVFIILQNKKLMTAYRSLFEKNIEIIELQDQSSEKNDEKYKSSTLSDDLQKELLGKILKLMEDTSVICEPDFSLDKLSELVDSNQNYVSQVINTAFKKNFRTFLNRYRIREAQRLYSKLDTSRFTVESVALRVGFRSPSAFRSTFKEVTGVSPGYYLKSVQGGIVKV
ncbi:MAG: helix-turn-helix domain-containing protein [Lentimicrobiaceae bacterium]|nr:helix-turn-helix domain-containing protein [Lentimicrobiaceae bacterium]